MARMQSPTRRRWFQFGMGEIFYALVLAAIGAATLRYEALTIKACQESAVLVPERQVRLLFVRCACVGAALGAAMCALRLRRLLPLTLAALCGAIVMVIVSFVVGLALTGV
jgi:hypothetical protein